MFIAARYFGEAWGFSRAWVESSGRLREWNRPPVTICSQRRRIRAFRRSGLDHPADLTCRFPLDSRSAGCCRRLLSSPVLGPLWVGVNLRLIVHFCLAAKLAAQVVPETAKSPVAAAKTALSVAPFPRLAPCEKVVMRKRSSAILRAEPRGRNCRMYRVGSCRFLAKGRAPQCRWRRKNTPAAACLGRAAGHP